jgi:putative Mg2+ transporter-C (MgtC) family protein
MESPLQIPYLDIVIRISLAALFGGLIGWERYFRNKLDSEIRTFAAVCLGACGFGMVASSTASGAPIAAQVVSGIGFLGASVILREQGRVKGIATAATLWATASVGLALGYGLYILGCVVTLVVFLVRHVPDWRRIDSTYQNTDDPGGPSAM